MHVWCNDEGVPHEILQGEGGEQGDGLMPALHALASTQLSHKLMPPSVKVRCSSRILTTSMSSATLLALQRFPSRLSSRSARSAGIQVTLGKTKQLLGPEDSDTFGAEVWSGEGPEDDRGLAVLGVPVGHKAFEQKWLADKGQ